MPRLTKIYTRTGDDGTTGLGGGQRVAKTSARIAAYGAVDELSAHIGAALSAGPVAPLVEPFQEKLARLGTLDARLRAKSTTAMNDSRIG